MSEGDLSKLSKKVERLEEVLCKAAGEYDDLGDRLEGLGKWIDGVDIDNGEERLARLEGQLEPGTIWILEDEISKIKDRIEELSRCLDVEAGAIRKEAAGLSDDHESRLGEICDKLEAVKELVEGQADEIAQLTARLDEVTVRWAGQAEGLKNEIKKSMRGLASEEDVAGGFQDQERRYEAQLDSLQRQLNSAEEKIAQLSQAVARPAFADRLLGCILAIALFAVFAWLAIKVFYWVVGLLR